MKNFKKAWKVATRCLLIIATIVAMSLATFNVGKVTFTQFRLAMIYSDIQSAENARDYANEQAQLYKRDTASYYQNQADRYDEEIITLMQKRSDIQRSDDPIIAWSAKDGFEHSIFWPSVVALILIAGLWLLVLKHLTAIINIEEKVFNAVVYASFNLLSVVFFFFGRVCYAIASVNYRKKHHRQRKNSNIVAFDKKRRLG